MKAIAVILFCLSSALLANAQCPLTGCPSGQVCFTGAGSGEPQCVPGMCGNVASCPTGQICIGLSAQTGSCVPALGGSTGRNPPIGSVSGSMSFSGSAGWAPCSSTMPCNDPAAQCVLGACIPGANSACSAACATGFSCLFGQCAPNANAPCTPACSSTQRCAFSNCVPIPATAGTCTPACSATQVCASANVNAQTGAATSTTNTGTCINLAGAACSPACPSGFECVNGNCLARPSCNPPCTSSQRCAPNPNTLAGFDPTNAAAVLASGMNISYTCITPGSSTCSPACSATQTCVNGVCTDLPVWARSGGADTRGVPPAVLTGLGNANININNLPQPQAPSGNTISANGNAFIQATGSQSFTSISFTAASGGSSTGANAQAAFQVSANGQVTAGSATFSVPNTAVVVDSNARFQTNGQVTINAGATVTYSFTGTGSSVVLDQLNMQGSINVNGQGTLQFPTDPSKVTVGSNAGTVQVGGGAALAGNGGTATIDVSQGDRMVRVASGGSFVAAGNILGQNGVVSVDGSFDFGGASIQSRVNVNANGVMRITGSTVDGGDLSVFTSGSVEVKADGKAARFREIRNCTAGAWIVYYVQGRFSGGTGSGASGTAVSYGAGTAPQRFSCGLRVIDLDGKVAVYANPRPTTSSASGQGSALTGNILAESDGSASWGSTELTYTGATGSPAAAVFANLWLVAALALLSTLLVAF